MILKKGVKIRIHVILVLLFFTFLHVVAQKEVAITIIDKESGEPIPFVNICFESLDKKNKSFCIAGENGRVKSTITGTSEIAISMIGYHTLVDTISPGNSKTFYLEPDKVSIDEVVITGQFKPVRADKSIYKINVISKAEIENKAANNLTELLTNDLSVQFTRDGALGSSIRMMGLTGEHIKVLVDGVPVIGRQNGILDLDQVSMQRVKHVEIIEGPMSVIYGSNAMAGVINLITKDNFRPEFMASLDGYHETAGTYNFDGSIALRRKNNNFNIYGSRNFFGGYSLNDTSRFKLWKPKLQYNTGFFYAYNLEKLKIKFGSDYFHEELRDKGNLNPQFNYEKAFDGYHFTRRNNSRLEVAYAPGSIHHFQLLNSLSNYRKIKNTFINDLVELNKTLAPDKTLHDTTTFTSYLFRGTYSYTPDKRLNIQTGYDINLENARGKRIEDKKSIEDYAGFLSLKVLPAEKFTIQPGIRFIYNSKYNAPVIPAISFLWKDQRYGIRFSYGRGFRAPSLKELYLDFVDVNHNVKGNENLKAEKGHNMNFSANYHLNFDQHRLGFDVSMFYNKLENKIDLILDPKDPSGTKATYFNISKGKFTTLGYQAKVKYQFHPRLTTGVGYYTTGRSRLDNLDAFTYTTDYTWNMQYKNLKYRFQLNFYYKYTDEMYFYSGVVSGDEILDVQEGYRADFHNFDITLSRSFFNNNLDIAAGVKNLFDNVNIYSSGATGQIHGGAGTNSTPVAYGRIYFLKIGYNLTRY
jgi:outer membrane receptor for ferrienterochelin and colicins